MSTSVGRFIARGAAAGAAGGAAAALFIGFVTERSIEAALRFEEAASLGLPAGDPMRFSRETQLVGGMVAAVVFGVLLGVVLGVLVAVFHHRLNGRNEFERIGKVALAGFVSVSLIPALKYPPNPPAVGDPDTIGDRSTEYMLLVLASAVVVFAAWRLWGWLGERGWDGASRFLAGGGAFVLLVTFLLLAWPATPDAVVPPDNVAAPALVVREDAPPEVLDRLLATARARDGDWLRDPREPDQPLDLSSVRSGDGLAGTPAAVSTTRLVDGEHTTIIWRFRLQSLAGLALLWAVMAGVFGLLADRDRRPVTVDA